MGQTHSVLGWIEGPIAEYADLRGVQQTMMNLFDKPDAFHEAASIITDNAIEFALLQIKAGADMIGVGDAAASLLGPNLYKEHVFPYEKKLFGEIHSFGAMAKLHICGDISGIVGIMAQTGADVLDIDSMVPLDYAREQVGESKVLCGNFAPSEILLQGNPIDVAVAAKDCIQKAGKRFFLMPGCEVPPATTEENISAFCPCPGSLVFE
jgi:MtaA/CmuA family methyltransferase